MRYAGKKLINKVRQLKEEESEKGLIEQGRLQRREKFTSGDTGSMIELNELLLERRLQHTRNVETVEAREARLQWKSAREPYIADQLSM